MTEANIIDIYPSGKLPEEDKPGPTIVRKPAEVISLDLPGKNEDTGEPQNRPKIMPNGTGAEEKKTFVRMSEIDTYIKIELRRMLGPSWQVPGDNEVAFERSKIKDDHYDGEDIYSILWGSSELDWQEHPAKYLAICARFDEILFGQPK